MAYREAKTPSSRGKVLHHLEIHPKMGGGVDVQHHYYPDSMEVHNTQHNNYGADEREDFHKHIAKHTDGHFHQVDKAAETDKPADVEREAEEV